MKDGASRPVPMFLRDYLQVRNAENRKALARLYAGDYPLAVETLTHGDSAYHNGIQRLVVPLDERRCRFCADVVETPEHALLTCAGSPTLVAARVAFLVQINRLWPDFTAPVDEEDALPALRSLLGREAVLSVLGAFTHKVFQIFRAVELPWPAEFVKRKPVV